MVAVPVAVKRCVSTQKFDQAGKPLVVLRVELEVAIAGDDRDTLGAFGRLQQAEGTVVATFEELKGGPWVGTEIGAIGTERGDAL